MNFKKGFKIKPDRVNSTGAVIFTDGTNDVIPNELACKAYGYNYTNGVCSAFNLSAEFMEHQDSETLINNGFNNKTNETRGSIITGSNNNTAKNANCLIVGDSHSILPVEDGEYLNNASIIGGTYGKATIDGEVVIGGGGGDGSTAGQSQMSIVSLSGSTTGGDITLFALGDTASANQIYLPNNSISIYEVYITGLCVGGSAGTAGHFLTKRILGSLLVDEAGAITKTETIDTDTGTNGNTGSISLVVSTANIFSIQVAGRANTAVNWSAIVKLYTNQTIKATF